jgi:hypothetical protein
MTNDAAQDFDFGDLEQPAAAEVDASGGARVADMVRRLEHAKRAVESAENVLKERKALVAEIEEKLLPTLLDELRCDSFSVPNGPKVEVKKEITASLPVRDPQRRAGGIAWLERNGYGSIVKYKAEVEFARGDQVTAKAFQALVESWDRRDMIDIDVEKDVHHSTLTATVKEMAAEGVEFPRELLGFHERRVAKIVKRRK